MVEIRCDALGKNDLRMNARITTLKDRIIWAITMAGLLISNAISPGELINWIAIVAEPMLNRILQITQKYNREFLLLLKNGIAKNVSSPFNIQTDKKMRGSIWKFMYMCWLLLTLASKALDHAQLIEWCQSILLFTDKIKITFVRCSTKNHPRGVLVILSSPGRNRTTDTRIFNPSLYRPLLADFRPSDL